MIDQPELMGGQERHVQFIARRYPPWYVEHCAPVTLALAAYAWDEAEAGLERAAVAQPGLEPLGQTGLELVLATQRFFLALHRDGPEAAAELWPALRARLAEPGAQPAHEPLRLRQFIIHRCQADRLGWESLPQEEVQLLLAALAQAERNQYLWHELAMLAYRRAWDSLLQQAYSELSVSNDGLMGHWFYHHARLMLRLRTGVAQREDAAKLLAALRFASQAGDVRQTVLPVLEERGWLRAAQLDSLERRVEINPPTSGADLLK
jgi:hypothetical protein